mmetsp:Transcript_37788/g.81211  ORF Transcript_37788/g.81211 Transcript_37788/m.81211 type:complete len:145 (-) Transcript_37788:320-754(-)
MEQDTLYKALPTLPELCRANHSASGGVSSTSSISSFKHIQTTLYLGHFGAYLKRFDVVWVLSHHDLGQVDRSFFAWQTEGIEVPVRQKEATAGPAVIGSLRQHRLVTDVQQRSRRLLPGRPVGQAGAIGVTCFCKIGPVLHHPL